MTHILIPRRRISAFFLWQSYLLYIYQLQPSNTIVNQARREKGIEKREIKTDTDTNAYKDKEMGGLGWEKGGWIAKNEDSDQRER